MKKVMKDVFSNLILNNLKKLHKLHDNLRFLPERMKIEKVKKLVTNLRNNTYVIHIKE